MSDDEVRMKRPLDNEREDDDDDCQGHPKRQRGEGPKIELRILLQSKHAGAVIGKSGSNIKRLRTDYKASVTVPDSDGPERILTVGAELGTVLEVLLDVIPTLDEHSHGDGEYEVRMLVHQSQAGCIIGRAGFKIKDLREKTGANIKVFSQCCPNSTDRVVSISGKPRTTVGCIEEIIDLLQSAPPKGHIQPYDPRNFDEFYAHDYGGYTLSEGGRGKGMGSGGTGIRGAPPPPLTRGGLSNMRGGRGGMGMGMNDYGMGGGMEFGRGGPGMRGRGGPGPMGPPGMRGGMRSPTGMGPGPGPQMGRGAMGGRGGLRGSLNGGLGGRGMGGGYNGSSMQDYGDDMGSVGGQGMMFGDDGPKQSTQVTIPKDVAGAIIGKGGSRITEIRRQSMAQIVIDEAVHGSNDRIITITGTQDQIRNAQFLLQMRLSAVTQSGSSNDRE